MILAARRGDPRAFARFVEHWDRHLRRFVHLTLGDGEHTDQVLAAAYVRSYRALPTYRGELRPGLWLHRVAFLTVTDRIRRESRRRPPSGASGAQRASASTSPTRADALPRAWTPPPDPRGRGLDEATVTALSGLSPDKRALTLLVDGSGFAVAQVAEAFDADETVLDRRLQVAREALAPAAGHLPADRQLPEGVDHADGAIASAILAAVTVPPPGPSFWTDLGRRLLAEREQPAAPTIDPVARLARAHPSEPGFRPDQVPGVARLPGIPGATMAWPSTGLPPGSRPPDPGTGDPAAALLKGVRPVSEPVATLADRAERERPPRDWRRPLGRAAIVLATVAIVVGAVVIGTSSRTPDGSVSARELSLRVADALSSSPYLHVDADVDTLDPAGEVTSAPYRITLAEDGSWTAVRRDQLDSDTYDASIGLSRRVVVVPGADGAEPAIVASETTRLAPGAPDPVARPIEAIDDLRLVGPLLRQASEERAAARTIDGERAWTFETTVPSGIDGASQRWRVTVRREDGLPVRIERHQDGELVRDVRFSAWEPASAVPDGTHAPDLPADATVDRTDHGFDHAGLVAVELLGRGPAVTPGWLPEGFTLATVAVRGQPAPGSPSTAGGTNPPDLMVMSLAYQRGPERITVTIRDVDDLAAWTDPFAPPRDTDPAEFDHPDPIADSALREVGVGLVSGPREDVLGDGRYNGARVQTTVDALGRARLWGTTEGILFTVAGDLSHPEAVQVAASLR